MEYQLKVVIKAGFWYCDKCNTDHYRCVSFCASSVIRDINFCDREYAIKKIQIYNEVKYHVYGGYQ